MLLRAGAAIAGLGFVAWGWSLTGAIGAGRPTVPPWFWPPLVGTASAFVLTAVLGAWAAPRSPPGDPPPEGPPSNVAPRKRVGLALDVLAAVALAVGGFALQAWWGARSNPTNVMTGMDHLSFTANVVAWSEGAWADYNTDKPVLHALLGGLLARAVDDYPLGTLLVSRYAVASMPLFAWAMARPLYGRLPAFAAGVLVMGDAELWTFATQTTNYALYASVATAALAAVALYARFPSILTALITGVVTGLALATSEKALITLAPAVAVISAALLVLARRRGEAWRREPVRMAALLASAGLVVWATRPPVAYTPFGNLLGNQRAEIYVIDPYPWPAVRHPDPAHPFPYSDRVPAWLRSPDLDVTLAALATPNDSNILRLELAKRKTLVEVPYTSLPPAERNFARNYREFTESRALTPTRVLLVLVGAIVSLWRPRAAIGAALALALVSGLAPLTLKHQDRYFLHLLPLGWVLTVGGLDTAARLLAGASRPALVLGRTAAFALTGLVFLATVQRDTRIWAHPQALRWPPPTALARGGTAEDIGRVGESTRALATWIRSAPPDGPVHDCSPHPIALYLPPAWDIELGRTDPLCDASNVRNAPAGTLLVASAHMENRGPGTIDPRELVAAGWTVVARAQAGHVTQGRPVLQTHASSEVFLLRR